MKTTMYVSELGLIEQELIVNMLVDFYYSENNMPKNEEFEDFNIFLDNAYNSRLCDLSDTIDINVIIEKIELGEK